MIARLSLDEITNGEDFEELVAAFFRSKLHEKNSTITSVEVKHTGVGPDGGTDVLVDFRLSDTIFEFTRRIVVQCKFHSRNVSPSALNDNNIPTLIHSHNADGYLLICKGKPTSKLTALFKALNENCKLKYKYHIWSGEVFVTQLLVAQQSIKKQFFPKYFREEVELTKKLKKR